MSNRGLSKDYGSPATRDKRTDVGGRRYVRAAGSNGFVLRPACGCGVGGVTEYGDPLICPDCGGARLTKNEVKPKEMS